MRRKVHAIGIGLALLVNALRQRVQSQSGYLGAQDITLDGLRLA